jgi:hypothetical protein
VGAVCAAAGGAGDSLGAAVSAGADAAEGEPDAAASDAACANANPVAVNSAIVPMASPDVRRFIVYSSVGFCGARGKATPRKLASRTTAKPPRHAKGKSAVYKQRPKTVRVAPINLSVDEAIPPRLRADAVEKEQRVHLCRIA